MEMRGNTILITGGGSGIGRGLAEAFHKLGNQVIVAGRRAELLRQVCAANQGMSHFVLDVTNPESLRSVVGQVTARFPELNCVIANAGVQRVHSFDRDEPVDERAIEEEIATNLLGVIRVCAAFLPHLRKQPVGYADQCFVRPCLRASGDHSRLLCHQGGRALLYGFAALATEELEGQGH